MLTQNTFPDFFDESTAPVTNVPAKTVTPDEQKNNQFQDLIQAQSKKINLEKLTNKKNFTALVISCISAFLLVVSGILLVNLQLWFIPLFFIIFAAFTTSTIFTYLLQASRNVIWLSLIGVGVPFLALALITSSLLTGSTWIALILILFLLFIAFLETENALTLNRVFIFKNVIYQPKKLIIMTSFLLITFGAFMGINFSGGPKYIENTIGNGIVYPRLFDPTQRTALFGKAIISEKILKLVDGSTTADQNPLTYQDFLQIKVEDSTKTKVAYYEAFAEKTYCKESSVQTDDACKEKLAEFAKLTLGEKSKNEYGVDVINGPVKLNTPMTKDTIKTIIQKSYSNSLNNFINSSSSATNPLKVYSILGKKEGVSLFIATIIFALLLLTFILFNLIATLVSWFTYKRLKAGKYLSLETVTEQVEVLKY
jgi:hypothetical protein